MTVTAVTVKVKSLVFGIVSDFHFFSTMVFKIKLYYINMISSRSSFLKKQENDINIAKYSAYQVIHLLLP